MPHNENRKPGDEVTLVLYDTTKRVIRITLTEGMFGPDGRVDLDELEDCALDVEAPDCQRTQTRTIHLLNRGEA